jgi:tRNA 2-thiocytidine biosynthesis protein TtcA
VLRGPSSKRLKLFCKHVGRAIHRFKMIENGDRVLIGVSGGKDSLSLAFALAERKKWIPITYDLAALHIEWREYPLSEKKLADLARFFEILDIPFKSVQASLFSPSFHEKFNCYLCSRNRKRILFTEAQRGGFGKIALAHNLDDVIETTLINLFYGGEFSTMMPVQSFFEGKLKIIRPMVQVKEKEVQQVSRALDLPIISSTCPNAQSNQRIVMKEIIRNLSRINRRVRENIYRAPWNINIEYLPVSLESDYKLK